MKNTMKKIFCSLFVVVMCLTSAPLQGFGDLDRSWLGFGMRVSSTAVVDSVSNIELYDKTDGHAHSYGNWYIRKAATCSQRGEKVRYCVVDNCNAYYTQSIPVEENAHIYGTWTTIVEATCISIGEKVATCSEPGCGHKETRTIKELEHILPAMYFDDGTLKPEWEITVEPIHGEGLDTQIGYASASCVVCSTVVSKNLSVPHVLPEGESTVIKEPTCSDTGAAVKRCTICDDIVLLEISMDPDAHVFKGKSMVLVPATCCDTGIGVNRCTACGNIIENVEIPVDENAHVGRYGNIIDWVEVKSPYFHSDGVLLVSCEYHGDITKTILADHGLTDADYKILAKPTCVQPGLKVAECKNCHRTIEKEIPIDDSHLWGEAEVLSVATNAQQGVQVRHCDRHYGHILYETLDENIYNLGEETYSFKNADIDPNNGHCFGMSITSSGYHLGLLSKANIGLSDNNALYSLELTNTVRVPIDHYQAIQGKARDESIVAGGTYFKYWPFYNAKSDWKEIVNYVKNHEHDGAGDLIIGYTKKSEGCHAINFLRYEVVDGQERIYAYDNNFPDIETYFYQDVNDYIRQAVRSTFSGSIDCIALVDVNEFFNRAGNFVMAKTFYAVANSIEVTGAYVSPMCVGDTIEEIMMYEILDDVTEVTITPLVDNATFTYMDKEYSFGKIDEDTYAEFTLSTSEEDAPEFEIINAPEEEPEAPDEPQEETENDLIEKIFNLIKLLIDFILNLLMK